MFVYFHGGGFIFGDKSSGDPLAQGEGDKGKMSAIVKAGYALVNADYALSPEYRFPIQLEQVDELMRYLLANADKLGIDMSRVGLSGISAILIVIKICMRCCIAGSGMEARNIVERENY